MFRNSLRGVSRETILVLVVSALFTLPVWIAYYPPMTDYPEHLAIASILRWYHDPARNLVDNYFLVFDRPNVAFVYLVAGLSLLVPLEIAGKLVIAVPMAMTGWAGLSLARRAGRPGWYGLFALLSVYNYSFFFGFVNNVIATPMFIYGIVLADRLLDRALSWRGWLSLSVFGCLMYFTHMQFLFVYLCVAGWLVISRVSTWRETMKIATALSWGMGLGLYHHLTSHSAGSFRYDEIRGFQFVHEPTLVFDKLIGAAGFLFGERPDQGHWIVFLLFLLAVMFLIRGRTGVSAPATSLADGSGSGLARVRATLAQHRYLAVAAWLLLAYFILPDVFVGQYVYQRMVAMACLLLPAVLPVVTGPNLRGAKGFLVAALAAHLLFTCQLAYGFHLETRGGFQLVKQAEPGKNLVSMVILGSEVMEDPPPLLHFGVSYLASKGGRVHKSFTEMFISAAQLRRGLEWDDVHAQFNDWMPYAFRFNEFGYHFDYFLIRGEPILLPLLFHGHLGRMQWKESDGWWLFWRRPETVP